MRHNLENVAGKVTRAFPEISRNCCTP